jgi:hypothetical protein
MWSQMTKKEKLMKEYTTQCRVFHMLLLSGRLAWKAFVNTFNVHQAVYGGDLGSQDLLQSPEADLYPVVFFTCF